MSSTPFTVLDTVIVVAYLAGTLAIGLAAKRFLSNISDFLVAGRGLGLFLGIATLAATETGTVTFMYYAQLGFQTGFSAFITGLISGLVMLMVGYTGFIIRRFRALELMTVPEYFERQYSRGLRVLTGCLVAIGGILNMGMFLRVEGSFLVILTGIPFQYLKLAMTAILLIELLYTVVGGMLSIVITDFVQYVALSVATIIVTIYCVVEVGWGSMVHAVSRQMGSSGFNPLTNSTYGASYILWQVILWTAVNTCWQTTAMRTLSMKSPELSKKVFGWTGLIFLGRGMLPMVWGIAALAALGPHFDSMNAMPTLLAHLLGPGVKGLVVAGMLAATMSVNSSYLLGWSSIISQDIIGPLRRTPLSSRAQIAVNRVANVFVSGFILWWSLWYTLSGPLYLYLNLTATIFLSGTFAAVIGGLYWKRANLTGGYAAMIAGAVGTVGYFFLNLPATYSGFAAFGLAALAMVAGTLLGERRPRQESAHV
ncbi:MAG TPA: sodium:solute symporter family protein [Terriglobales bacterium]|nr:sodium:solute symporter family protein [Terriglobales bacterium]